LIESETSFKVICQGQRTRGESHTILETKYIEKRKHISTRTITCTWMCCLFENAYQINLQTILPLLS